MTWHVQYRQDDTDYLVRFPTPEAAIAAACHLIDEDCDVYGIGTATLDDSITREEVARIYALWARAKVPFGTGPH